MEAKEKVLSVVQVGSCKWGNYYAPVIYRIILSKRGAVYKVHDRPLGYKNFHGTKLPIGYRSQLRAIEHAKDMAQEWGVPYVQDARHGKPVKKAVD